MANVLRLDELIREVRGQKVIFDTDLARIYGIPTFRLNEAVKRNRERFPDVPAYTCGGCGFEIAICDIKKRTWRAPNIALRLY